MSVRVILEHNGLGWLTPPKSSKPMEFVNVAEAVAHLENTKKHYHIETVFYIVKVEATGRIHVEQVRKLEVKT